MKTFITLLLALIALQLFASPLDMYKPTKEYLEMQEKMDKINQQIEEKEETESRYKKIACIVAIAIGLIPVINVGSKVVLNRTWESNPSGTTRALAIAFAGGLALFALNYAVFLLKIKYGTAVNAAAVVLLVLALTIGAIYVVNKKSKP